MRRRFKFHPIHYFIPFDLCNVCLCSKHRFKKFTCLGRTNGFVTCSPKYFIHVSIITFIKLSPVKSFLLDSLASSWASCLGLFYAFWHNRDLKLLVAVQCLSEWMHFYMPWFSLVTIFSFYLVILGKFVWKQSNN